MQRVRRIFLGAAGAALLVGHLGALPAQATCATTTDTKGWAPGANVKVSFEGVGDAAKAALLQALASWTSAMGWGGSFTVVDQYDPDEEAFLRVIYDNDLRTPNPVTGRPSRGLTDSYSPADQYIQRATMRFHPDVTSFGPMLEVALHEVGHSFGLADCRTCGLSDSVMSDAPLGSNLNSVAGRPTGPTACDTAAAQAGYASTDDGGGGGVGVDPNPPGVYEPPVEYCTPWYRYTYVSGNHGETWSLESVTYEGCW